MLLGWQLLQFGIQMNVAASADLHLALPVFESGLFHRDGVVSLGQLQIRGSIADEASVDFDVGSIGS